VNEAKSIVVNGEAHMASATTVAALLDELGYTGQKVATALNGEFVAASAREAARLMPGDHVEIVSPRQGG
jgi:sulfur carrier protein